MELNIKGIKSGGAFWYAPWPTYYTKPEMPVRLEGLPIVNVGGDLFFIDAEGNKIWPHCIHFTAEDANKCIARVCRSEIEKLQAQLGALNIVLAKLDVRTDNPQPDETDKPAPFANELTELELKIPF